MLDAVEAMVCPPDLAKALTANATAKRHFEAFPPSVKKGIYQWVIQAKRPETRARRVADTIRLAEQNIREKQPRQPEG